MLITPEYKQILADTHKQLNNWGTTAASRYQMIVRYLEKAQAKTLLDYGSGSGGLKFALDKFYPGVYNILEYEPAVPEKSLVPEPCEFVVCIDVLEHVEPQLVDNVLDDLKRVIQKHALLTISTEPAHTILADGRNAHLTVQPFEWWNTKITQRFDIIFESHNTRSCLFFIKAK